MHNMYPQQRAIYHSLDCSDPKQLSRLANYPSSSSCSSIASDSEDPRSMDTIYCRMPQDAAARTIRRKAMYHVHIDLPN